MLLAAWFALANGWKPLVTVLGAAVVHEAGHWLVLRRQGAAVTCFRLSVLGAAMETEPAGGAGPDRRGKRALARRRGGESGAVPVQPAAHPPLGRRPGAVPAGFLGGGPGGWGGCMPLGGDRHGGGPGGADRRGHLEDWGKPVAPARAVCRGILERTALASRRVCMKAPRGAVRAAGRSVNRPGLRPAAPGEDRPGPSGRPCPRLGRPEGRRKPGRISRYRRRPLGETRSRRPNIP